MDQTQFIDLLRRTVVQPAISGTIAQIATPTGRNLSANRKERAAWYQGLSEQEQKYVEHAITEAAQSTAFGLCCILDGARAITDHPNSGHLELRFLSEASDTLLASSAVDMPVRSLHEQL